MNFIQTIAGFVRPESALPLRLLSRAHAAAIWLRAHPIAAIALLAAAFGGLEQHRAAEWAMLARQRGTALAAVQSANARAIQQAHLAKESQDAYYIKLAAKGDRTAADLRDRYHVAVMQFAAAQHRARRADLPGAADAPARSDRPGESSSISAGAGVTSVGLVEALVVTQKDAMICADNTARLQAVHDWATALGK